MDRFRTLNLMCFLHAGHAYFDAYPRPFEGFTKWLPWSWIHQGVCCHVDPPEGQAMHQNMVYSVAPRHHQEQERRALQSYLNQRCDVLLHLVPDGCTPPCRCRPAHYQSHHIQWPLGVGIKQFAEKPMTCSNAWARLTKCCSTCIGNSKCSRNNTCNSSNTKGNKRGCNVLLHT